MSEQALKTWPGLKTRGGGTFILCLIERQTMREMVYRVMTVNGDYPFRAHGLLYREIFQDKEYAKRCKRAIKRFNSVEMIIEEAELQWKLSGS